MLFSTLALYLGYLKKTKTKKIYIYKKKNKDLFGLKERKRFCNTSFHFLLMLRSSRLESKDNDLEAELYNKLKG